MHLDRDFYTMVGGEFPVPDPVGLDLFLPLPGEHIEIFGRPRAGDPVRIFGLVGIAGAAREIDDDGNFQLFRQQDGLATGFGVGLGDIAIRM